MNLDFSNIRILIAGDIMLDRYWFGEVNRISPEAPVPVVRVEREEVRLGGAANVARNTAALGAKTSLLGITGADESSDTIYQMLTETGISPYLSKDSSISTIVKLRVIGRQQQLLRVDFEKRPDERIVRATTKQYNDLLTSCDVVILSDYAKGSLLNIQEMIQKANQAQKPVLIDPKGDDFKRYLGATILTPNKGELRQIVGAWTSEEQLTEKAQNLRRELNLRYLLLTRSEEGMSLYSEGQVQHVAAIAREVYDVSGAGDTVIATLAAMMGIGKPILEAVEMANRAAGIVVGKLGTAIVTPEELFS